MVRVFFCFYHLNGAKHGFLVSGVNGSKWPLSEISKGDKTREREEKKENEAPAVHRTPAQKDQAGTLVIGA